MIVPTSLSVPSECAEKGDEGEIMDCHREIALKDLADSSQPIFDCKRIQKSNMFDVSIGSSKEANKIIEACMTYAAQERNVDMWFELLPK